MNERYAKLSADIVFSSIWEEDGDTCKVWITLLALKDREGIVNKNITGIARLTKLPIEKVEWALNKFQNPDPMSNTDEFEGRRVRKVEQGWLVLNHQKYQELGWSDEKRQYERERKARYRESKAAAATTPPAGQEERQLKRHETGKATPPTDPRAMDIIICLNHCSGQSFRGGDSDMAIISARLAEDGVDVPGVKKMIARQCQLWLGDPKMERFLRPETLFRKSKFDAYYAAKDMPVTGDAHQKKNVDHSQLQENLVLKDFVPSHLRKKQDVPQ